MSISNSATASHWCPLNDCAHLSALGYLGFIPLGSAQQALLPFFLPSPSLENTSQGRPNSASVQNEWHFWEAASGCTTATPAPTLSPWLPVHAALPTALWGPSASLQEGRGGYCSFSYKTTSFWKPGASVASI